MMKRQKKLSKGLLDEFEWQTADMTGAWYSRNGRGGRK
jgi:hypothetical protein